MDLVDTHCHLQFEKYDDPGRVVKDAMRVGVSRMICVGTSLADSQKAIDLATRLDGVWASAGCHPHEAAAFLADKQSAATLKQILDKSSICAIGEIGLDYYKNYSSPDEQKQALRLQLEAGLESELPFIFHVRDAWKDFWPIFDSFPGLRGVIHSFSAHPEQLEQVLSRNLYVALNGIVTFTKDKRQLAAARQVPLDRLLLETDAPFLTPAPLRNDICEPKHVRTIAEFLAELRGEPLEKLAAVSTRNAANLFKLDG